MLVHTELHVDHTELLFMLAMHFGIFAKCLFDRELMLVDEAADYVGLWCSSAVSQHTHIHTHTPKGTRLVTKLTPRVGREYLQRY